MVDNPPAMSKICISCGKGPAFGQNRSHSLRATKRRFDANLQRVRVKTETGAAKRAWVCTGCIRADKVIKA